MTRVAAVEAGVEKSYVSAELFSIPLDSGRFLIYAPLRRAAFVANARVVNVLTDVQQGGIPNDSDPDLIDFLRRLEILDAGPELQPLTEFSGDPKPTEVTLFLTTTCNLRCTYCYASAGDTPARNMQLDVAKRGIDFVAANAVEKGLRRFGVNYHGGGEPSGNWKVLTGSHEYACAKSLELGLDLPESSAATNGVLREDQIDWMIANLRGGVSVSFDGLPSAQDRHRLTILGQGSSQRVMHTLRRFDQAGYPYGIRVTVTEDQIAVLPDSVEFICAHFTTERIQVEPAYNMGRWKGAPSAETDAFIGAYREAQERANRYGRNIFFSGARSNVLSNHFCGVTQDLFALTPDGNVSACYESFSEENPWAHIFLYGRQAESNYHFEMTVLDHLRHQSVEHRAYCQGCFAKWNCSGDCYHKSLAVTGEVTFQGTDRCHIIRELTKDQILANISTSGGLFWHAAPDEMSDQCAGKEKLL